MEFKTWNLSSLFTEKNNNTAEITDDFLLYLSLFIKIIPSNTCIQLTVSFSLWSAEFLLENYPLNDILQLAWLRSPCFRKWYNIANNLINGCYLFGMKEWL